MLNRVEIHNRKRRNLIYHIANDRKQYKPENVVVLSFKYIWLLIKE